MHNFKLQNATICEFKKFKPFLRLDGEFNENPMKLQWRFNKDTKQIFSNPIKKAEKLLFHFHLFSSLFLSFINHPLVITGEWYALQPEPLGLLLKVIQPEQLSFQVNILSRFVRLTDIIAGRAKSILQNIRIMYGRSREREKITHLSDSLARRRTTFKFKCNFTRRTLIAGIKSTNKTA